MVTPNRDRSVSISRLEEDWEKAKLKGQGEIVRWASQHLNIEIGLALRSDRWVGADYWEQATDSNLTLDNLLERSETVVIGIDGGGLDDLLGLAVLGREKRDAALATLVQSMGNLRSWIGGKAKSLCCVTLSRRATSSFARSLAKTLLALLNLPNASTGRDC